MFDLFTFPLTFIILSDLSKYTISLFLSLSLYIYVYTHILLKMTDKILDCPVAPLQRGKTHPPNECPGFDTKQFDGEVPVMLELWGMWSTLSLPLLPGPLWPGMVAPDMS